MPLTPKSAKYEPLRSLCDLKTTRDLTNDGVRDLLRRYTRDHGLEVVRLGALEDMSGLNDAFNRYRLFDNYLISFNPIPTSQGRNQPLYERHVTKSGLFVH